MNPSPSLIQVLIDPRLGCSLVSEDKQAISSTSSLEGDRRGQCSRASTSHNLDQENVQGGRCVVRSIEQDQVQPAESSVCPSPVHGARKLPEELDMDLIRAAMKGTRRCLRFKSLPPASAASSIHRRRLVRFIEPRPSQSFTHNNQDESSGGEFDPVLNSFLDGNHTPDLNALPSKSCLIRCSSPFQTDSSVHTGSTQASSSSTTSNCSSDFSPLSPSASPITSSVPSTELLVSCSDDDEDQCYRFLALESNEATDLEEESKRLVLLRNKHSDRHTSHISSLPLQPPFLHSLIHSSIASTVLSNNPIAAAALMEPYGRDKGKQMQLFFSDAVPSKDDPRGGGFDESITPEGSQGSSTGSNTASGFNEDARPDYTTRIIKCLGGAFAREHSLKSKAIWIHNHHVNVPVTRDQVVAAFFDKFPHLNEQTFTVYSMSDADNACFLGVFHDGSRDQILAKTISRSIVYHDHQFHVLYLSEPRTKLRLTLWNSGVLGERQTLKHCCLLELAGVPVHCWNQNIIADLLSTHFLVQYAHREYVHNDNTFSADDEGHAVPEFFKSFKVTALAPSVNSLPQGYTLKVFDDVPRNDIQSCQLGFEYKISLSVRAACALQNDEEIPEASWCTTDYIPFTMEVSDLVKQRKNNLMDGPFD